MEGRRLITLIEPPATDTSETGQTVNVGEPIEHRDIMATRRDRSGFSRVEDEIAYGEWNVVFRIRMLGFEHLNPRTWRIRDEYGEVYTIEHRAEDSRTPRQWWLLYAKATK